MEIFLDSANLSQIQEAQEMGLIDGVTTNPSLMKKEGVSGSQGQGDQILQICSKVRDNVSAEVLATEHHAMIEEAESLYRLNKAKVVVKIPMGEEGLKAVKVLSEKKIRTNVTLIFSPLQGLLAAKAGATFISPFVGRLDDVGQDGMDLIQDLVVILKNYNFPTKVLVASVRHFDHILKSALLGAHAVTVPLKVLKELSQHPLTEKGLQKFLEDAKK